MEVEIYKIIFCNNIKNMRYLGMNLVKYVQDLYDENYKTLKRN